MSVCLHCAFVHVFFHVFNSSRFELFHTFFACCYCRSFFWFLLFRWFITTLCVVFSLSLSIFHLFFFFEILTELPIALIYIHFFYAFKTAIIFRPSQWILNCDKKKHVFHVLCMIEVQFQVNAWNKNEETQFFENLWM